MTEPKESIIHLILAIWKLILYTLCTFVDSHLYSGTMNGKIILSIYFKLEYGSIPLSIFSYLYLSDCRNIFCEMWSLLFFPRYLDTVCLLWFYNVSPFSLQFLCTFAIFVKKKNFSYSFGTWWYFQYEDGT